MGENKQPFFGGGVGCWDWTKMFPGELNNNNKKKTLQENFAKDKKVAS